ncbi:hypothetical protein [Phaeobacter inhibens]|uniref:hypothetical protein n=1 Tax=Phaeobacter inhibens TaxID=221822 RepID=UPI000ACD59DF|nr:hypothetical protein [Phaeobacter inhibens]WHP67315.1 hypothetical protein QMZ01_12270 [Phaeobacter inhibens]
MAKFIIVGKNGFKLPNHPNVSSTLSGHSSVLTPQLADFLLNLGHDVSFVFPVRPGRLDQHFEFGSQSPKELKLHPYGDTEFHKTPQSASMDSFIGAMGSAFSSTNVKEQEVIVISVYGFPFAPMVESLRSIRKFKHIVLLRGGDGDRWLSPERLQSEEIEFSSAEMISAWYRNALLNADVVCAASKWLAERARSHGVCVHSISPTPPPQLDRFEIIERSQKTISRIEKQNSILLTGKKLLLFAGRDSPDKRPDLALKAFERWNPGNWSLLMFGIPKPEHSEVSSKGRVGYLTVSPVDLAAVSYFCDGFLHTSLKTNKFEDARPSAVSIAASSGCPVVFPNNTGGVEECVSKYNRDHFAFEAIDGSINITTSNIVETLKILDCDVRTKKARSENLKLYENIKPSTIFKEVLAHALNESELA